MLRYYITDRRSLRGSIDDLLLSIERAAAAGVDFIQIREKDLPTRALLVLVQGALEMVRGTNSRVLVNDRIDVALAAGAHGAHLRSNSIAPGEWRRVVPAGFLLGISCHTPEEAAGAQHADFVVFGPVFETPGKGPAVGLEALRRAASVSRAPVLALGGVNAGNADACVGQGAAGIAGIRLFQGPTEPR